MRRRLIIGAAALALLGACDVFETEPPPLPGERIAVRQTGPETIAPVEAGGALTALGPPVQNADWAQPNAIPSRAPGHLAGPAGLSEAWRANLGGGSGTSARITSTPIVSAGRIVALTADSRVTALDLSGRTLWTASVTPEGEDPGDGFGGGLAAAEGRIFAATGFGEVVALDAATGGELWRRGLGGPMRSAPAVEAGRVFAVTRDSIGYALDAASGEVLWRAAGASGGAGVLGGASPAASGEIVVFPFASGEIAAVRASNGRRLWSDALAGGRRGSALAEIADVSGDPVISGAAVFAANQSGLLVAIDGRTGERGWTRDIGSTSPVWSTGGTVFAVDVNARLLRLSAVTGLTIWTVDLPAYEDPEDREGVIAYAGPVVAGGRVFITSSAGELLAFDAATGAAVGSAAVPGGSTTGPIVAGGVIYVLSDDGVIHAFR